MKQFHKYYFIILASLVFSFPSYSQLQVGPSFNSGVFISNVVVSDHKKWEAENLQGTSPLRYGAGVKFSLSIAPKFRLAFTPGFVKTPLQVKNQVCLQCANCYCPDLIEMEASLLSFPLQLSYSLGEKKEWQPFLMVGFTPYYVLNEEVRYFEPDPTPQERIVPSIGEPYHYHENVEASRRFRAINFTIGGGMNYRLSEEWEARLELKALFDRTFIKNNWNIHGILGFDLLYRIGGK